MCFEVCGGIESVGSVSRHKTDVIFVVMGSDSLVVGTTVVHPKVSDVIDEVACLREDIHSRVFTYRHILLDFQSLKQKIGLFLSL